MPARRLSFWLTAEPARVVMIAAAVRVVACLLVLAATAEAAAAAPAQRRCRDVVIRTGDGSVYTRTHQLRARGTGCRTARRVGRVFLRGSEGEGQVRPLGFRCRTNADRVACVKGDKRVTWSFR